MTNEEAKFVLHAYRPGGGDAGDATFCAALEQTKQDPALAAWFERQQAFDRAVAAKLREVMPPADLRASILAGARASSARSASGWRRPAWLAAAAGVAALLAVSAAFWPRAAQARGGLMEFIADDARHSETHGGQGGHNGALQAHLNDPGRHLGGALPIDFDALLHTGCRSLRFEGHDVLEICFKRDGAWFHCYILRREDFRGLEGAETPVVSEAGRVAMATWADATHVYVVVSKVGSEALRRLL